MSDPTAPVVTVTDDGFTVTLPSGEQTVTPMIPAELRDREIPLFVLEWIMESDEIATLMQELLQAPTRSLCRIMYQPEIYASPAIKGTAPKPYNSPTPPVLKKTGGVLGFSASGQRHLPGMPEGIKIPMEILEIIQMARKVDAWLYKGQRVAEWALENGAADATWLPAAD